MTRGSASLPAGLLPPAEAADLERRIAALPDPAGALRVLQRFVTARGAGAPPGTLADVAVLAGFSPWLGDLLVRHPEHADALPSGGPRVPRTREDLEEELARFLFLHAGEEPSIVLRRFKQREYLRIALADFTGGADLPAVTRALSGLADVVLDKAVQLARGPLVQRYGSPVARDDRGQAEEARFAIIALGKLGGEELNYSSDIDLMYLFSAAGETVGGTSPPVANKEFFARLAAEVTRLIAGSGPEGQVFRVDLGLRPGGRDGDLALSLDAAVAYYANWAEGWERQALIKARPAAGDLELGRRFTARVEPLVYVPDPDPWLALDIAAMKDRIDARLGADGRVMTDVKLGWGGIRELEFAVQALQLAHGGRDPWLRQGNTLLALHRLADKGLVGFAEYAALAEAYVFLRDLEHRLQIGHNRQTAALPSSDRERELLARRLRLHATHPGGASEALAALLDRQRTAVRRFYDSVFGEAAQRRLDAAPAESDGETGNLWLDRADDPTIVRKLAAAGFAEPGTMLRPVTLIRRLLQPAPPGSSLARALRRNGAALLKAIAESPDRRRALANLERLISSLGEDREALAAFLMRRENLAPTVRLLGRSDFLGGLLIRQPAILSVLEKRGLLLRTPDAAGYRRTLRSAAGGGGERRAREGRLRRRHQEALATIALRDINRQAPLGEILASLSDLADATIDVVVDLARAPAAERPGPRLAVLGLGRLGYREMDYGSDLDLVFVHDGSTPAARTAALPWCQDIVRTLSTLSRDGQLYPVDLRLRPSGREGDIATSLDALRDYVRGAAEVWEMQSFLKARPVAGDAGLGERAVAAVESLALEAGRARGPRQVAIAVESMRRRLQGAAAPARGAAVKTGAGGMLEIHFIIEFLQLSRGVANPAGKDTLHLLEHLHREGLLDDEALRTLYGAYRFLRAAEHGMRLLTGRPAPALPDDPRRLEEIGAAVEMEVGLVPGAIAEELARRTSAVRRVYDRIVGEAAVSSAP